MVDKLYFINLLTFTGQELDLNQFYSKIQSNLKYYLFDKTSFIKWYQKKYNQSRRQKIVNRNIYTGQIINYEIPYTFGYVDKDDYITFISAEQAWNLYNNYRPTWTNKNNQQYHRRNRYSYRNGIQGRGGERYYTQLADIKYEKSLGHPRPRGGHKKNAAKNHWDEWELEVRSECANWKRDTKLRHQYERKICRNYKKLKKDLNNVA